MMFLDCPAYLDQHGAVRCGLPAEVRCRFTMRSTEGPVESAMIRCPADHYFCAAIESLTWDRTDNHDFQHGHDDRHGDSGPAPRDIPVEPKWTGRRPNTAPSYYLGHPARLWITVMRPRRRRTTSDHAMQTVTGGGEQTPSQPGGPLAGAGAGTAYRTPATSWPVMRGQ